MICYNVVDRKYETVILPIYGVSTPFHISTIKVFIIVSSCDYFNGVVFDLQVIGHVYKPMFIGYC